MFSVYSVFFVLSVIDKRPIYRSFYIIRAVLSVWLDDMHSSALRLPSLPSVDDEQDNGIEGNS